MPIRPWLRLIEILAPAALAIFLLTAWQADQRDRAKLAADLARADQALAQVTARQRDRDAQLTQTLSTLAAEKRSVTTPAEILRELAKQLPLPAPIVLQSQLPGTPATQDRSDSNSPSLTTGAGKTSRGPAPNTPAPRFPAETANSIYAATIPAADLKPLFDYTIDCQACRAKLTAAQADLVDEKSRTATLTREKNEAVRAAKGGSSLRRAARAAKWFAIGAAAGAIAARARH